MNPPPNAPLIRVITASETRPLRQRVLRPGQRIEELVYSGDDDPDTRHFGAFVDGLLVGIASIYHREMPEGGDSGDWQLRGMATLPDRRQRGVGARLLEATIAHVAGQGGRRYWCHARTGAEGFYRKCGFTRMSDLYEIAGVGPHVLMSRPVSRPGPPLAPDGA